MNPVSCVSRRLQLAFLAGLTALLAGCATGPDANPRDPLEPFNRGVYRFNDAVDTAVVKPVATAYVEVTPQPVRTGVNNFFSNLGDLWSTFNALFQLRPREAGENLAPRSISARPWVAGACLPDRTWCCRSWAPRRCATPVAWWSIWRPTR